MSATIRTTDPATGQPQAGYEAWDTVRIEAAVERAHAAARAWARVPVAERATRAGHLATVLREHKETLAQLAVTEMGKPVGEAEGEVSKSALTAKYWSCRGTSPSGRSCASPSRP